MLFDPDQLPSPSRTCIVPAMQLLRMTLNIRNTVAGSPSQGNRDVIRVRDLDRDLADRLGWPPICGPDWRAEAHGEL